jgi:GNAT superfamily N-acetyltransferase
MTHDPAPFVHAPLSRVDIPAVMELYRRAIQPVWREHGRDHDLGRVEANIRAHLGARDYWMTVVYPADDPGELVGYLAWDRHEDHSSTNTVAHLRMILVDPRRGRAGLGRELVGRFEAAAREAGCSKILFDVVAGSPARAFYDALGYRHWSDYMEKML